MKLQTTLDTYTASNNELCVDAKTLAVTARSYGWWDYIKTDSVGNIIFNDSRYSNSTTGHQSNSKHILGRLGLKVAIALTHTTENGCSLDSEIEGLKKAQAELQAQIDKKGSWRKTNILRAEDIQRLQYRINDVINFRDNYYNKKLYLIKQVKISTLLARPRSTVDTTAHYFKKPNGKIDRNGLHELLRHLGYWPNINNLSSLITLFDLKNKDVQRILTYKYIQHVSNMIPNPDTIEYMQLLAWCKRQNINKKTLNSFLADKMHEYLVNKSNRKNYEPSEPIHFPVADNIRALETNDNIVLLDTDRKLRAEGRKQNHCIGNSSMGYINKCHNGYHALNFKGFTFFLDPVGKILERSGRHNGPVPTEVCNELNGLIMGVAV